MEDNTPQIVVEGEPVKKKAGRPRKNPEIVQEVNNPLPEMLAPSEYIEKQIQTETPVSDSIIIQEDRTSFVTGLEFNNVTPSLTAEQVVQANKEYSENKIDPTKLTVEQVIADAKAAGIKVKDEVQVSECFPKLTNEIRKQIAFDSVRDPFVELPCKSSIFTSLISGFASSGQLGLEELTITGRKLHQSPSHMHKRHLAPNLIAAQELAMHCNNLADIFMKAYVSK